MIKFGAFFLLICFVLSAKTVPNEKKWELTVNEEGVKVWAQEIPGHDIVAIRTRYTIKAPVTKVLALLRDAASYPKWVKGLKKVKYIKEISDLEATTYEIRNFPFPLTTRDMIIHYKLDIDKVKKALSVEFHSIKHKKYPKDDDYVRAVIEYGYFNFWPTHKGTRIELTMLADPKGSIPNWIINLFQKSEPLEYILTIEKEALKAKSKLRPGIKKLIDQYLVLYPTPRSDKRLQIDD